MSELNFSDVTENQPEDTQSEPISIAEDSINENVDLDIVDLVEAEVEAVEELDGFQIEEPTAAAIAEDTSAVEDAEDPYRKFRLELRNQPGKWYVVHSYAGYERRVKQNIETRKLALAGGDDI
ncbi:MAG: transcription termination/antitermination protein NusG, partial [Actinomycetota bacterium]